MSINHRRISIAIASSLLLELINKISPLLILHHAQKSLGLAEFGWAQYQLAFFESVQPLIVYGFANFSLAAAGATRDEPSELRALFSHVFVLKAVNAVFVIAGFILVAKLRLHYALDRFAAFLLLLTTVSAVADAYWLCIAKHKLASLSLISGLIRVGFLGLILLLIDSAADKETFVTLSMLPNAIVALGTGIFAYRSLGFTQLDKARLKRTLLGSTPFAAIILLITLLDRADLFLVKQWFGLAPAGVYAGPAKIVQSLSFLISALALPFYAEILKLQDEQSLRKHTALSMWCLSVLIAPLMFGMPFIDRELLALVFPSSVQAGDHLLSLLALSMLGNLLLSVFGLQILMSKSRPWPVVLGALLALATLVVTSVSLKETAGLKAVALGMVLAKLAVGGFCLLSARAFLPRIPWMPLLKPLTAGAGMALALYLCAFDGLMLNLACGGLVYTLCLLSTNRRELVEILQHPRLARLRRFLAPL